ncbi:MAG: GNAT family N-acetyltransferase [Ruegeria sp.]
MEISIRPVSPEDTKAVSAILSDPTVMLGTMRLPFVPDALVAQRTAAEPGLYRLVAECEDEVVAFSQMTTFPGTPRHNHVGEIDLIAVRSRFQGRGIGKALMNALLDLADNWLQLERTGLLVWSDNKRAISLYEAFGFEIEGTLRRYARRPGGFADANTMARLIDENPQPAAKASAQREHAQLR